MINDIIWVIVGYWTEWVINWLVTSYWRWSISNRLQNFVAYRLLIDDIDYSSITYRCYWLVIDNPLITQMDVVIPALYLEEAASISLIVIWQSFCSHDIISLTNQGHQWLINPSTMTENFVDYRLYIDFSSIIGNSQWLINQLPNNYLLIIHWFQWSHYWCHR